jgi:hypothetical protein
VARPLFSPRLAITNFLEILLGWTARPMKTEGHCLLPKYQSVHGKRTLVRQAVEHDEAEPWRIVPDGRRTGNLSKDLALKFVTASQVCDGNGDGDDALKRLTIQNLSSRPERTEASAVEGPVFPNRRGWHVEL